MDMSLLGIIVALVVLIIICYRKFNPVVGTLICVAILAIFSGLSVLDTITDTYFTGFSDFLKNNFLLFATGTVFASLMEGSGAAAAFAKMIYSKVGGRGAIYGCMLVICKRQIILICAGTVATTSILPFHSLWNFNDSFAYSIVICYFLIKCNSKKYCKCQSN